MKEKALKACQELQGTMFKGLSMVVSEARERRHEGKVRRVRHKMKTWKVWHELEGKDRVLGIRGDVCPTL